MVAGLTKGERQLSVAVLIVLTLCGLLMAGTAQQEAFGIHGFMIALLSVGVLFIVISGYFSPAPSAARLADYYDDPSKIGIILALIWAVFALFVGDWIAWLLAFPEATFDAAWSSYGRLRPVHTSGVIFGFGGNALISWFSKISSWPSFTTRLHCPSRRSGLLRL